VPLVAVEIVACNVVVAGIELDTILAVVGYIIACNSVAVGAISKADAVPAVADSITRNIVIAGVIMEADACVGVVADIVACNSVVA